MHRIRVRVKSRTTVGCLIMHAKCLCCADIGSDTESRKMILFALNGAANFYLGVSILSIAAILIRQAFMKLQVLPLQARQFR